MFSATLSKDVRPVCKKFMKNPLEIYVDDERKLTLHGLVQHYIRLPENQKNRTLHELLDALEFNQVLQPICTLRGICKCWNAFGCIENSCVSDQECTLVFEGEMCMCFRNATIRCASL